MAPLPRALAPVTALNSKVDPEATLNVVPVIAFADPASVLESRSVPPLMLTVELLRLIGPANSLMPVTPALCVMVPLLSERMFGLPELANVYPPALRLMAVAEMGAPIVTTPPGAEN